MKQPLPKPRRHHLDQRAAAISELLSGDDPERLMTTPETARLMGVSTSWLQIGRCRNYGPPSIAATPKMIRYRRRDLLAWIEERAALAATSAVVIFLFFAVSVLTALAG